VPVALLLRLLVRIAATLLFWRVATRGRGAVPPSRGGRAQPVSAQSLDARHRLQRAREGALIAGRVLTIAVLAVVAAVCIAAGLGPTILGPRWLGIVLLTVAAAAAAGLVLDTLSLQRTLAVRNRRRRDTDLARQAYP